MKKIKQVEEVYFLAKAKRSILYRGKPCPAAFLINYPAVLLVQQIQAGMLHEYSKSKKTRPV